MKTLGKLFLAAMAWLVVLILGGLVVRFMAPSHVPAGSNADIKAFYAAERWASVAAPGAKVTGITEVVRLQGFPCRKVVLDHGKEVVVQMNEADDAVVSAVAGWNKDIP